MVCCLTTPSHYLNRYWTSFMAPYGVTGPRWVNTRSDTCFQSMARDVYWLRGTTFYSILSQCLEAQILEIKLSCNSEISTDQSISWWRHQVEPFSALLALCAGNSPVPGELPAQRPVTRSFDVFFDLGLNKPLSKQSTCWWFETPSRSLWCQCNV